MKKLIISTLIFFFSIMLPTVQADNTYTKIAGEDYFNDTVEDITSGNFSLAPDKIISYIVNTFLDELTQSRSLLFTIFVIALVSGTLNVMTHSKSDVGNTAFFACFALMTISVVNLVITAAGYGNDIINEMSTFVTKLAPMLSILLASSGYAVSASSFYPVFSASVYFVCLICQRCIIPLVYAGFVSGILNNLSSRMQLNNFSRLIKAFNKWILTGTLTIFSAINAIYGFCTPSIDSVAMKTTKFAVSSIVPVVGGFLADSIETVMGGTKLMKNAVGTAGIISLLVACAIPCLKVLSISIMLKITSALIEPVSDKKYADMLSESADAITTVFAMMVIVAMLFILSIAIMIGSTNTNI